MECYICYDKESSSDKFVKDPCKCKGSNKIHDSCLKKLIEKNGVQCSICKSHFNLNSNNKMTFTDNKKTCQSKPIVQSCEDHKLHEYIHNGCLYRVYEDDDVIVKYTYTGNQISKIDYKYKSICSIV